MLRLTLIDPLFKGNFRIFVSDFGHVRAYVKARGYELPNDPRLAKTIYMSNDTGSEAVIWFRKDWRPNTPGGAAVLAHEALHAVHYVLRDRGISNKAILNEVGNYYVEWLIREVTRRSVKRLTPRKKR